MRDATPDQKRLHWVVIGLCVTFAAAFAWAGFSRWPFFVGSVVGLVAAAAEWRLSTPYPRTGPAVHVAPRSWWTRRVPGILGLPLVFIAFAADDIMTRGRVTDALGIAAAAIGIAAGLVWTQRHLVDRIEVSDDRLRLSVLLGLRALSVPWRDVTAVTDEGGDLSLQVRRGTRYFVSHELSDFSVLRDTLAGREQRA
ncbi:MAG: hypothetical protein M3P18_10210 [Actinomycetota bacterium]|nr:hypothetical protein [Actinomycetota bacterium]